MKKPKILVVGSINMDLSMYGLAGMPRLGVSTFCERYSFSPGGKGGNQALAVSRLGGASVLAGRVGTCDENAARVLSSLQDGRVRTEYIVHDPELATGMSVMNILPDGRYFSVYAQGANAAISPEDVEAALEEGTFDLVLMQLEMPLETVYRTYEMARERGIPVFLDAGPAMSIPLERLKGVCVISPNEAETLALTGIDPCDEKSALEAADWLYQAVTPQYVLLKLGSRGALLYDGQSAVFYGCFTVNAVDSTAAGDTFSAACAIRMAQGIPMADAIQFAHAAAALCVTREGGNSSIPTEEEAEEFFGKHRQELTVRRRE